MKILLNGCAITALVLGLIGQANAQIDIKSAPIYAVPSDPDAGQGALVSKPASDQTSAATAERAVAAVVDPPATSQPLLNPHERAFFAALGHRITDSATAYEGYVRAAGAIDARFTGARQVQSALRVAEAYNAAQLQEGAIAYAAVLALRNQAFVDGVRAQNVPGLADRLIADPDQVLSLSGANDAVQDVSYVMRVQAQAVADAGAAIHQAAYTVQRQTWSRGAVADPDKVLASAKTAALRTLTADEAAERRLLDSIGAAPVAAGERLAPTREVVQGLALAALAVLGQAGDAQESRFEPLLRQLADTDCLQMAKMNLNQCLAVAGPH